MKLHIFCSIILLEFCGYALAAEQSVNENPALRAHKIMSKNMQSSPGFSVFLYLPLMDDSALSSIMTQSQLLVTSTADLSGIRGIRINTTSSTDGTCAGLTSTINAINNGVDNVITLVGGHTYQSTDASNYALWNGRANTPGTGDVQYRFIANDNTTTIGNSVCIAYDATWTCTSTTNCGWGSIKTWTP